MEVRVWGDLRWHGDAECRRMGARADGWVQWPAWHAVWIQGCLQCFLRLQWQRCSHLFRCDLFRCDASRPRRAAVGCLNVVTMVVVVPVVTTVVVVPAADKCILSQLMLVLEASFVWRKWVTVPGKVACTGALMAGIGRNRRLPVEISCLSTRQARPRVVALLGVCPRRSPRQEACYVSARATEVSARGDSASFCTVS